VQHSEFDTPQETEEHKIPLRERLTFPPIPYNGEEKYPFDEWFDGDVWRLKQFEDYFVASDSMRSALYMAARRRKLKVKTHVPIVDDCVYVQATK